MRTQTAREMYPELVVRFTADGRPVCDWSATVRVPFLAGGHWPGGVVNLRFHPVLGDAARALAAVFETFGYPFLEPAGGTVSCRNITGASSWRIQRQATEQRPYATSLHAHGIALDINPSANRYRRQVGPIQWGRQTDMDPEMVAAVEAIRTVGGHPVWEWGGRWRNIKDPMHFQATRCTRADLEAGIDWSTVPDTERIRMYLTVKQLQEALNEAGAQPPLKVDGIYGPLTKGALVKALAGNTASYGPVSTYMVTGPVRIVEGGEQ